MVVTLFRHGMTVDNKRQAFLGWNDSPLLEESVEMLSRYDFDMDAYDLFLMSDIQRCVRTMEILFPKAKAIAMPELREMNLGMLEGKVHNELKHDKEYMEWLKAPFEKTPPHGGESFDEFAERVALGWKKIVDLILDKDANTPFIVTHGGVIRYYLTRFVSEKKGFWEWSIPHGTGYEFTFTRSGLRRGEKCISLREVHLTEREDG